MAYVIVWTIVTRQQTIVPFTRVFHLSFDAAMVVVSHNRNDVIESINVATIVTRPIVFILNVMQRLNFNAVTLNVYHWRCVAMVSSIVKMEIVQMKLVVRSKYATHLLVMMLNARIRMFA